MEKLKLIKNIFTKNKIFLLLLALFVSQVYGVFYHYINPIKELTNQTYLLNSNLEVNNIENWLKSYVKVSTHQKPERFNINNEDLKFALESYNDYLTKKNNSLVNIPEIKSFEISSFDRELDPPVEYIENDKIPLGESIVVDHGEKYIQKETHIKFEDEILILVDVVEEVKSTMKIHYGNKDRNVFKDEAYNELVKLQKNEDFDTHYFNQDVSDSKTLKSLTIQGLSIDFSQKEKIVSGEIELYDTKCRSNYKLNYGYNLDTQKYDIHDLSELKLKDCTVVQSYIAPKETKMLTCSDCKYAPVDKTYFLASTYSPSLVPTNLPGGGYLTPETVSALNSMADAMRLEGTTAYVTSAYRSYQQQQEAFNYWVNRELAKGADLGTARARANIYSAFPGHSEHQLGTTLDIRCQGCEAFSKNVTTNPVYQFLQNRAHEFGFVISYPAGKQHLTGYTYEPWHIRYIGVGLATELFNRNYQSTNNSEYLSKFLLEKGMY